VQVRREQWQCKKCRRFFFQRSASGLEGLGVLS
jgi:hypothetical protein